MSDKKEIVKNKPKKIVKNVSSHGKGGGSGENKRQFRPSKARSRRMAQRVSKNEFDQKILSVRRVTRVVSGGRRFSLSVSIVIGNKKGKIGIGKGKATDTALAIEKAVSDAKKNLILLNITKKGGIPHDVEAKYSSSRVLLLPSRGGLVAGGAVRSVVELAGIRNVNGKILTRSKNHLNNAKATQKALEQLMN